MTDIWSPGTEERDPVRFAQALQEHARQFDNYLLTTDAATTYAPIASPLFTGNPRAPTPSAGDNDTSIATTAFVATSFAPLASPAFTGNPTAPTPSNGDADTSIATTAFAANASNLTSGTVGTARLGSGSASSSTFLRGDQTWSAVGITSLGSTATNTGTTVTVTGIPSTAKRVTILLRGVSWGASAIPVFQVGKSAALDTTAAHYSGLNGNIFSASASNSTGLTPSGWIIGSTTAAANSINGKIILSYDGTDWLMNSSIVNTGDAWIANGCGFITGSNLGGTLDRVGLTTTTAQTFDAGTMVVLYE